MNGSIETFVDAGSAPVSTNNPDIPIVSIVSDTISGLLNGGIDVLKSWGERQLGAQKLDPAAAATRSDAVAAAGKTPLIQAAPTGQQIALYGGIAIAVLAGVVLLSKLAK